MANKPFNGKVSEKEFISEIKGCKVIDLKDFTKEVSEEVDKESGTSTTTIKVKGWFSAVMKKITKPTENKDSILNLILKELKDIKSDVTDIKVRVTNLEKDVADIKVRVANLEKDVSDIKVRVTSLEKDVADIKRCPTIQKELAALN